MTQRILERCLTNKLSGLLLTAWVDKGWAGGVFAEKRGKSHRQITS